MIEITFPPKVSSLKAEGLTQYDTGQRIEISGTGITTETVQVHFAASGQSSAIIKPGTVVDGTITAEIPDSVLAMGRTVTAWAYVITGDERETKYTVVLPVVSRVRPQDYISPAEPPYLTANELSNRIVTAEDTVTALTTELTTARNGEASLDERLDGIDLEVGKKASKAQPAWITATLLNAWEAFDVNNTPQYMMDEFGFVHFRGAVKSGVAGTVAMTLQAKYRPKATEFTSGRDSIGKGASGYVTTSGSLVPTNAAYTNYVTLNYEYYVGVTS